MQEISVDATSLGSKEFRQLYGVKYAYVTGAMFRGIASKELVVRIGNNGLLGYFGSGGLSLTEVEENLTYIKANLNDNCVFGMNVLPDDTDDDLTLIKLYLRHGVRFIEAAAHMQISAALVLFRVKGIRRLADGRIICENHILGKVSRTEVAEAFLSPPPERLLNALEQKGLITQAEMELARLVPVASEIVVEADSGGHTDMGIPTVVFPAIKHLGQQLKARYQYQQSIFIGQAGGIGSPEAAAAAFLMGADFILTGSINQCTVEAGTSDAVKDLLQHVGIQDTSYAPAGDMFEMGAKVQVLKRGVFFPSRANKLFDLYQHYNSLEEIPDSVRAQVEERFFKKSFAAIWEDVREYLIAEGREQEISMYETHPKKKMSRVFRWYFAHTTQMALQGELKDKVDFQIHTGPALGVFNQWVKGTDLERWPNRHVDEIAEALMQATAVHLQNFMLDYTQRKECSGF